MNKDVIYIDVEDDITTIVGKIKASKEKIVALVPPSRVGVLQSAVNMRLLARTAEQAGKRVVLISHNQSLIALAAMAKIPVARNLQSKPELVEIPALKVDDDVIDGGSLPVGEYADSVVQPDDPAVDKVIAESKNPKNQKQEKGKKQTKVPNFSSFRKKIMLIGSGVVILVGFLVWAIWFAPRATVMITAKTTPATIDRNVQLTLDGETNVENATLRVIKQEQKQDVSVDFTATGEKNIGEKSTGTVQFASDSNSALLGGIDIPANTRLTSSSGKVYTTNTAVRLTNASSSATIGITAVEPGASSNGASGSFSGAPRTVEARIRNGATTGGTDKMATVVSEDDIAKAASVLSEKKIDGLREKLLSEFASSSTPISDSYSESRGDPVPSVAVGSEATGAVSLRANVTATMLAVDQSQLSNFIRDSLNREIDGKANQKIYDDGAKDVKFSQFSDRNERTMVRVTANGRIGPEIKEDQVKEQVRSKRYGDIQASLEAIDGVSDVDTKFWPFWVRTVPDDVKRITVEFKLQDGS